jgi:hypothetical protein
MKYLLAFLLLAAPATAGDPPTWKVSFAGDFDEAAVSLACLRDAEHSLRCVSLDGFLSARDGQLHHEAELEAAKAEQRRSWYLYGGTEL